MAPHAEEPFDDSSGYTPSLDKIAELKQKLRICHARSLPNASWVTPEVRPKNSQDRVYVQEHPILQLSLEDLRELEDAFSFFDCKGINAMLCV